MAPALRALVVVVRFPGLLIVAGVCDHPAPAPSAKQDATGQLPEAISVLALALVVLDGVAGGVYPLARDSRLWHGHGYPLRAGFVFYRDMAAVGTPFRPANC